jgi:hypothetical protein
VFSVTHRVSFKHNFDAFRASEDITIAQAVWWNQ